MKTAMKKILAIFVVLAVCLSAASCFKKKSAAVNDPASEQEQSVVTSAASEASDGYDESAANEESPEDEQDAQNPAETRSDSGIQNNYTQGNSNNTSSPTASTTTAVATKKVPIPEGWTVTQIGERLEAYGVCTKEAYLKAIDNDDFSSYWPNVVKCVPSSDSKRIHKFEGYQFPATYTIKVGEDPMNIVGMMMRSTQNNIINMHYSYQGMSTDQIITLASIIELEASKPDDRKVISAILHKRLEIGQKLECDSATKYVNYFANLTDDTVKHSYGAYYNTYRCSALPEGPICNPGADALDAAVHPAANSEGYLYFLSDKTGKVHFEKTYEEHQQDLVTYGIVPATTD